MSSITEEHAGFGEMRTSTNLVSEDSLALIQVGFDHMDEGISMYDSEHRLVAWNRAFMELIEFPDDLVQVGRPIADLIRFNIDRGSYQEGESESILASRLALLAEGKRRTFDRIRADGRIVEIKWFPLPAGGLVITYRDVTEQRLAKEELHQSKERLLVLNDELSLERDRAETANKAKSEFLAAMSHELRTPLNAVIGFSEMISGQTFGPVGDDKYREYAEDIHSAGRHLLDLINDILDLAKVEAGSEELHEEEVNIEKLVRSVFRLAKGRADQQKVKTKWEIQDGLPLIHADRRKLKQILVNLLANAIKFNERGGEVTLKVWHSKDGFVFQVIDTGIGMNDDDIPKALSQFGQVNRNINRSQEGTGLGLPLAKSLVELHGGSLDLQSRLEVGTTVTVRFPSARTVEG